MANRVSFKLLLITVGTYSNSIRVERAASLLSSVFVQMMNFAHGCKDRRTERGFSLRAAVTSHGVSIALFITVIILKQPTGITLLLWTGFKIITVCDQVNFHLGSIFT